MKKIIRTADCRICREQFQLPDRRGRPPVICDKCKDAAEERRLRRRLTPEERAERLVEMMRACEQRTTESRREQLDTILAGRNYGGTRKT